ncbi:MAG: topoisomerase DNA-binding C4 zinc finger domain-containing protein, partial [Nanoarchaeota archaeon]|nr:topoisomerase DNA-binding C4 zinc finger domain-containing protein [Nanoarchaeota archaeon]
ESLERYSPIIIDENLTRQLEEEMEDILNSKSDFEKKEKIVIEKAKRLITDISKEFKAKEIEIGKHILQGLESLREEQNKNNTLMTCPRCKKGNLRILYSKKTRRSFVACSAYPACTQTYSLPPNALIKKSEKQCEADSFTKLLAIRKGKRPWEFCFNPECPIEKKKREEWQERKDEDSTE